MYKGYGTIKDLTNDTIGIFTSIDEAVAIIKNLYINDSDVVLGEFFASLAINHCSIEEVLTIVARAHKEIDGEDTYTITA